MTEVTYAFGSFVLDAGARRLERAGRPVPVADRHLTVLLHLVRHAGIVVTKDALVTAAWGDVAVTDNSLEQAVSALRKVLDGDAAASDAIQTVPRQGYRFVASVTRRPGRASQDELEALLAPHRAWVEGRALLETLGRDHVARAEDVFRSVVTLAPDLLQGHLGLANALAFRFESTRTDEPPDRASLVESVESARTACRIDPSSGEAWATLGFVLHRTGQPDEGRAAIRHALSIERDNWRHYLRLAFVSWGEERLRAASRTLQLLPGLALAHWLAASVHVARQAFDAAWREVERGTAAQDEQGNEASRFRGVGLYWLRGLVQWRLGDATAARASFDRELADERAHHLYARECCAHAWYAIGAWHTRRGEHASALRAFEEALERVPGHPLALAALLARGGGTSGDVDSTVFQTRLAGLRASGAFVDAATAEAIVDVAAGHHARAVLAVHAALRAASPGPAGWYLPVEPMLDPAIRDASWGAALASLRGRAA